MRLPEYVFYFVDFQRKRQLFLYATDHMKIIRTFSYLEKRSDYLFYLSIPTLIVRNEQLQQYVFKNNLKLIFFQLARYRQLKVLLYNIATTG